MRPFLPPPLSRVQRLRCWVERAHAQATHAWEGLLDLPPERAVQKAQRLVALGVRPHPSREVPVPGWMSTDHPWTSLPVASPLWNHVSPSEQEAMEMLARRGEEQAQRWAPWVWAWAQHPQGLVPWLQALMRAWEHGQGPLARVVLGALPGSAWQQQALSRWPWETLWRRPVRTCGNEEFTALGAGARGNWRHTLALWADVQALIPDRSAVERQLLQCPALAGGQGHYFGTSPDLYRWRDHHFQAWIDLGLPLPSMEWALWLMGLDWTTPNPWGDWLNEGFDPVVDRTRADQRALAAVQLLEAHLDLPAALRGRLLAAWLEDARPALGQSQELDLLPRAQCEGAWAEWLTRTWTTAPHESGWGHAVACAKGVPALRCRSLKKIWWSALPPAVFAQAHDGLLPWEVFRQQWGHQLWEGPHHQDIEEWLRHKSTEQALFDRLPPPAAPAVRSRF